MERSNFREFFRVVYPRDERPRLVLRSSIFEVLDCSERGLRFQSGPMAPFRVGMEMRGRLRLRRGADVVVEGVVVRVADGEVALRLREPGVSFHLILNEQIHLRRKRRDEESTAG